VAYIAEPLNTHRRHERGVTQRLDAAAHVAEIAAMHAVAAAALGLGADELAEQAAYLERVEGQLKAKEKEVSGHFFKKKATRPGPRNKPL
jgi:hypothetical protein